MAEPGSRLPAMWANLSRVTCGVWPGLRQAGSRLSPPLDTGPAASKGADQCVFASRCPRCSAQGLL